MENIQSEITLFDTRCWSNVLEGLKYTLKGWMREVVEEVISEKMCAANIKDKKLTAVELCKRWNISKNTLHNWERNGVIQPLPISGKKKLYSMADIMNAEANGFVKNYGYADIEN